MRPLANQGRLPNLQRLMNHGASGILQSTVPPVTPAAWTSVFTGKNPGKHGIYDFQSLDPQTYTFHTLHAHRHREKTVWRLAGEGGKRSMVIDVPFTYPPKPLEGLMITGYGTPRTPGTEFTFPPNLADRLPSALREVVRVALPSTNFDRSQRFVDEWKAIMNGRQKLLAHLASEEEWDFFMVVFSITDNMAHVFWTFADPAHANYERAEAGQFREAFYASYEQCDRLVGQLMAGAGPGVSTLIVSDHGFGSVQARQYLFGRLLEGGYMAAGKSGPRSAGRAVRFRDALLQRAVRLYSRFPALREAVKGLPPGRRQSLVGALQRVGAMPEPSAINTSRSRVVLSNFGLQIWLNRRQQDGEPLAGAAAEALMAELSDYLLADRDSVSGMAVIRAVHRGRDVYKGPFAEHAPDLIIEYNNLFGLSGPDGRKNAHTEGGHTHEGIFIAHGAGIQARPVEGARLIDLAPTILYLLGLPVPPDMDGRVVQELFDAEFLARHPIVRGATPAVLSQNEDDADYDDDEEADIREQLRQLGYL